MYNVVIVIVECMTVNIIMVLTTSLIIKENCLFSWNTRSQ